MHTPPDNAIGADPKSPASWDHSNREEFVRYYAESSLSAATLTRFRTIRDRILVVRRLVNADGVCEVVDIGCGPGASSLIWTERGHRVTGIDVSAAFVDLARQRAAKAGFSARFETASATDLPLSDASVDVCVMLELLEHVRDWKSCIDECTRVLRPGAALYLSTTNRLCPKQQEYNLPLYSLYPAVLKRRYETLAVTTRPQIANFATYPAVHWFSFYSLK